MSPYVLRVLVHQNHAFGIDYNQKSFDQRIKHLLDKTNLQASTKYPLQSEEGTEPSKTQVFHNKHTDIENYIKTFKGKEEYVKIFTSVNIEALLRRFREKYRIIGSNCKAKGNTVSSFQVEQNGTIFDICLATKQTGGQLDLSFKDADVYHHFSEAYAKINRALLTKYLSKYNKHNENHKETDFWLEKVSSLPTGVRRPLHCGSQWPTSSTHLDSDCLFKQGGMWWVANLLKELKRERERTAEGTHAQYVDRPCSISENQKLRLLFSITTNKVI
jgi:ribosome-associated translation inhibitor RaiA